MRQLASIDWLVIAFYFLLTFGVAAWATRWEMTTHETSADYFLAGRNVGWFVVGASLFASNIGSEHLVGLAGAGAANGVAVGQFEVLASLILLILGWVFVPFYHFAFILFVVRMAVLVAVSLTAGGYEARGPHVREDTIVYRSHARSARAPYGPAFERAAGHLCRARLAILLRIADSIMASLRS